ncbi:MAG: hypothetical protein IBJ00_04970 [Alphaproteobacteria bacterium]|nr:hypothetical protein [Alphaproteobacteria bacterium]
MNENNLKSLPPEIACLTNLKILDLRSNKLSAVPAEIKYLTQLSKLFLVRAPLVLGPYSNPQSQSALTS